jgi:transposase
VIARFAAVKKCEASVPASAEQQCLKALSRRLQQLSRLAADQKNQRQLVSEPRVLRTFDAVLTVAKQQMREVEAEIAALLASDPLWQKLDEALRSIKGVAGRTVARVLADLPEIGNVVEQSGVEVSGSGTAGARQREARRKTSGAWRSPQCASDFVCGGRSGAPIQSGLCSVCGTDGGQRET